MTDERHDAAIRVLREEVNRIRSVVKFYRERHTTYPQREDTLRKLTADADSMERTIEILAEKTWGGADPK
jgi:hypothetical protein